MNHWIDHYEWELIERVGPPTCRENDGKGGEILVYKYAANGVQIPGKISSSGNNIYYTYPTQLKTKLTMQFYVNPKGKIYHCRCESNIDEMNSVTNFYIILLIIYVGAGLILLNTI
ncbi:hypothetical protein K9N50_00700 [bacterium]|nr:hypothetical protein [bacterium]